MSLEFTLLQCLKTSSRSPLPPDDQICEMVKRLDGKIRKWQVVAPTPQLRVLYFEADDGFRMLEKEEGSSAFNREVALGKDALLDKELLKRPKRKTGIKK